MDPPSLQSIPVCLDQPAAPSVEKKRRSSAYCGASRRKRTNQLLESIVPPVGTNCATLDEAILQVHFLNAPDVDWDTVDTGLDPQKGGKLKADSIRGQRKRSQVEGFLHLYRSLGLEDGMIVDAGSGAGNLTIPLSGLLRQPVVAIDINQKGLDLLDERASSIVGCNVVTQQDDLANAVLPPSCQLVCSLHACGAATDMAIRLATANRLPFVMSPCCIGKVNTARPPDLEQTSITPKTRSGSVEDISYPRSQWLHKALLKIEDASLDKNYATLAKVADIGLGPQTSTEQIRHQRLAKYVVEMDRLMAVVETEDYRVQMYRLEAHGGVYGKQEIFLGLPNEHPATARIQCMTKPQ